MGIQFEKLKKSDRPTIPVKQGRVRGNKNIFKVGLRLYIHHQLAEEDSLEISSLIFQENQRTKYGFILNVNCLRAAENSRKIYHKVCCYFVLIGA